MREVYSHLSIGMKVWDKPGEKWEFLWWGESLSEKLLELIILALLGLGIGHILGAFLGF